MTDEERGVTDEERRRYEALTHEELLAERDKRIALIRHHRALIADSIERNKEERRQLRAINDLIMQTRPTCSMPGCERPAEGRRRLCAKHIQRERVYGSPEAPGHREHLTERQVLEILDLAGTDAREVARRYGIGVPQVKNIWSGRAWRWRTWRTWKERNTP